jgi:hypothetical protein
VHAADLIFAQIHLTRPMQLPVASLTRTLMAARLVVRGSCLKITWITPMIIA